MLHLDLLPAHTAEQVLAETTRARGPRSLATHLKSRLNIQGLKLALLHELVPQAKRIAVLVNPSNPGEGEPSGREFRSSPLRYGKSTSAFLGSSSIQARASSGWRTNPFPRTMHPWKAIPTFSVKRAS